MTRSEIDEVRPETRSCCIISTLIGIISTLIGIISTLIGIISTLIRIISTLIRTHQGCRGCDRARVSWRVRVRVRVGVRRRV